MPTFSCALPSLRPPTPLARSPLTALLGAGQALEIRRVLDEGPGAEDDWPALHARAEALADTVLRSWHAAGRPPALGSVAGSGQQGSGQAGAVQLDVVCSGGGWRNMYCGGAYAVLRALEARGCLVVRRAAGASSGALAAATIGCNAGTADVQQAHPEQRRRQDCVDDGAEGGLIPCRDWYRLHDAWDILYARYGFTHYNPVLRGFIRAFYPSDAAERCCASGTAFSVSVCGASADPAEQQGGAVRGSCEPQSRLGRALGLPQRLLASDFRSFRDLEGAILASSALPWIIGQPFFWRWRGYHCLDGGLVDNCPVFADGKRPQLVVDLGAVPDSPPLDMLLLRPPRRRVRELWEAGMNDCAAVLTGQADGGGSAAMRLLATGQTSVAADAAAAEGGWAWVVRLLCVEVPALLGMLLWLLRARFLGSAQH